MARTLRGHRNVHAWNLPDRPDPRKLDHARYAELLIRAASNIFQPLGVSELTLGKWVKEQGMELELVGKDLGASFKPSVPCTDRRGSAKDLTDR